MSDAFVYSIRPVFCQCGTPGTYRPAGPSSHSSCPFPSLPFPPFPSPPSLTIPAFPSFPSPYLPIPSFPLEVGPINPARGILALKPKN